MKKGQETDPRAVEKEIISRTSMGIKQLPMLDVIFSGIPTDLTSAMKSSLGLLTEISSTDISYTTWGSVVSGMGKNDICAVSSASPWKGGMMIVIEPKIFYAAFEMQLNGDAENAKIPERAPSTIERRLAKRFSQVFLDQLSTNFNRVTSVRFVVENIENTQQVASTQAANSPCVVATTMMKIGKYEGAIRTIIPVSTLDPAYESLSTMFLGENFEADVTWRDMLSRQIKGSCVEVQAVLDRRRFSVSEILKWKPGYVLDLGIDPDQEMIVTCSGMDILRADRGYRKDRLAMRITRENGERSEDGAMDKGDMKAICENRG